ncbi:uncharacterized protein METZ01_LOCUS296753 [marine metagenome]|uniref:Uncharacterized protein n=1 Tax=marine metagenome TaxID=408172 RepID=A0A382M4S3_9ZZZZ
MMGRFENVDHEKQALDWAFSLT